MSFLIVLISLWLAIKWRAVNNPIRFKWFMDYYNWVQNKMNDRGFDSHWIRPWILVLPPTGVIIVLTHYWQDGYLAWMVPCWHLLIMWLVMVTTVADNGPSDCAVLGRLEHNELTLRAVFIRIYYRYCAPIFWFMVSGVAGAFAYRLLHMYQSIAHHKQQSGIQSILRVLDWVPMRITGFTYVLLGDFVKGFAVWKQGAFNLKSECHVLLTKTGLASINYQASDDLASQEIEATNLAKRALIFVMVILSVLSIAGLI